MPFKSKKQMRWMYANHPEMAKRWSEHTENIKALPEKVEDAEKPKTKKQEVKEAMSALGQSLFDEVVKQAISGPLSSTPTAPKPAITPKPVQPTNGPLVPTAQYGANLQQNVKNTATQLTGAKPPVKSAFLRKLAEGPVPAPVPPTTVTTPPPVPAAVPAPAQPAPTAQPAPQPAPPVGIGKSKWTKGVSSGQGNFALPSHVRGRIHSQSPDDYSRATAIWNLRRFAPVEYKGKLQGTSRDAITSQDIANLHAHHQREFMDYISEADPKYQQAFAKEQPHVFDVMSGKAGTPEQRAAAEAYLNDLDERMVTMGKNDIAMAMNRASNQEQENTLGALDYMDKRLRGITGTDTKQLANLAGMTPESGGRTWGGFAKELGGNAAGVATSPLGALFTAGLGGVPGALASFIRPDQGAGALAELARSTSDISGRVLGHAPINDLGAEAIRDYADAGLSGFYGLAGLGGAANLFRGGKILRGLGSGGLGLFSGTGAVDAISRAPSLGEISRGQRGPGYELPVPIADATQQAFTPGSDNSIPRFNQLGQDLEGIPAYAAAGKFDLGALGKDPRVSSVDQRIANLASMPAAQQQAEIAKINKDLLDTTGATYEEYTAYKQSNDKLSGIRKSYDDLQQRLSQNPEDPASIQEYQKAEADFVLAQKEAAKASLPFLTKALDKRYQVEIQPMEANIGNVSTAVTAVMDKISKNIPLTAEDIAAVQQGKLYMQTAKSYAFEKARLAFMKDGNLSSPGIDKIFAAGPDKGFAKLSSLFSGRAENLVDENGQPLMVKITGADGKVNTVPLTRNTNILETVAKSEFDKQVSQALGVPIDAMKYPTEVAKGPQPINGVTSDQQTDRPFYQSMMDTASQVWEGLGGMEKALIVGGLSLTLVAALSSMFGGDEEDDDEEDGGSGLSSLLAILGIGAVASVPLMRYFGGTQASAPAAPAAPPDPVAAAKARAGMAAIEQAAKTDPNKAAKMVADQAKADPKTMESFTELDGYYKNNWKSWGYDVTPQEIAKASKGKLTVQQAAMLKQHWPLVRKELGFK